MHGELDTLLMIASACDTDNVIPRVAPAVRHRILCTCWCRARVHLQSTAHRTKVKGDSRRNGKDPGFVIPYSVVRVVAYAIAAIVATLVLGTISSRLISFDDAATVLLFGLVIGVLDAFIKPVVKILPLPITCVTFGLFALVINAGLFYLGGEVTPGMELTIWGALFGSILTSIAAGLMFSVMDE
jgi:putative membrane protein